MPVTVADIGGTNARFAISSPKSLKLQHVTYLRCADFAGVEDAYAHFLASVPESIMQDEDCLLYTSPSPRDSGKSRMPSSA